MKFLDEAVDVLCEIFSSLQLLQTYLLTRCSIKLYEITAPNGLRIVLPELLEHLDSRGKYEEFLFTVETDYPNPRMVALANKIRTGPSDPPNPGPFKAIQSLVVEIESRMDRFGYMNACKRLHDILHGLHREYGVLDMAVQTRMRDKQPLSRGARSLLTDLISDAEETCEGLEFQEQRPEWIDSLKNCLEALTGDEPDAWTGALLELERLPAKEMRPLNDRLVDNASRIDFEQLSGHANVVLQVISDLTDPGAEELRTAVELFGRRCRRMTFLVKTHNICQLIDERLSPIREPVNLASKFYDWRSISPRLNEFKESAQSEIDQDQKLADTINRIADTCDAAKEYQASSTLEDANRAFNQFRATFNDLFDATDKEVLKNSSDIYGSIKRLVARLVARLKVQKCST